MTKASRLLLPVALLWLAGVLTPLVLVLRMSLHSRGNTAGEKQFDTLFYAAGTWSLESFTRVLTDPFYHRLFGFTALLAIVVTTLTLLLGYVLGYTVYRASTRGKIALISLIMLPKFTNILVFVFGVKMMFGASGLLPVVAGEALLLVPYAL